MVSFSVQCILEVKQIMLTTIVRMSIVISVPFKLRSERFQERSEVLSTDPIKLMFLIMTLFINCFPISILFNIDGIDFGHEGYCCHV